MEHQDIVKALEICRPGSTWTLTDKTLIWSDTNVAKPNEEELQQALRSYTPKKSLEQRVSELELKTEK